LDRKTFTQAHDLMTRGLSERLFTGAVLRVSQAGRSLFQKPYGTVAGPGTGPVNSLTLFDLASLTKVIATTPCWMILAARQPEILDHPVSRWFPGTPADKSTITPRLLLAHSSGLPAWRPYYLHGDLGSPTELARARILGERLEYPTGQGWVYSDLGFILLAAIVHAETGRSLDVCAREEVFQPLGVSQDLLFRPTGDLARIALTRPGEPPGLVNDLNTRALGGMSGHAGLFGTAQGASAVAEEILWSCKSRGGLFDCAIAQTFCRRADLVSGSTRALGFDTPSEEGSSGGRYFSAQSLGHTGFTGTSIWMDPQREIVVTLCTNRVFMGESDARIKAFRPSLHDAIMQEFL
jgi:serine-type D-Ala-D-Ala carboxypeptidase